MPLHGRAPKRDTVERHRENLFPAYLVETDWLQERLRAPDLWILDCTVFWYLDPDGLRFESGRAAWTEGHIPGSGFVDLLDELSDPESELPLMMPSVARFADAMSRHGVGEGMQVVLYDANMSMWAARVWWMLRAFGFADAAVLNGGWHKWQRENRPVSTEMPDHPPGNFVARPRARLIVGKEDVLSVLGDDRTCLINALSEDSHRAQRIPGSVNIPAVALLDPETQAFLPLEALRQAFEQVGALNSDRAITYCGVGVAASSDAFILTLLGRPAILEALTEAVERAGRPTSDYLGITATSLRQGFVLLDQEGCPLAPGVLNYGRRGAGYISEIDAYLNIEELYRLTGHWHAPELTLPKLLWFRAEQPDVWKKAAHFMFVHDWVLHQLYGQAGTNPTMICAGQMADVVARTWAEDLLVGLGLHTDILPPVYEGGARLDGLSPEVARSIGLAAGTPVYVGGGDTQFGCLGVGGMGAGEVVIVGGSTTPIMMTADRPVFDPLRYPWVSTHLRPGLWAIETNASHTGMIYKWFRDTFATAQVAEAERQGLGPYDVLNQLAAEAPIGSEGLLVVATSPRWAQDTWQHKAPYAIFNFNVNHQIGHVARAILESVCYGVRGNLEQLERVAGERFGRVLFTGGSAGVPLWAQLMADVLRRPLHVPQVAEPAALAGAQLVLWGSVPERLGWTCWPTTIPTWPRSHWGTWRI